jgi:hypothetical protein
VGQRALLLQASAPERIEAGCAAPRLLEQPRLADARLAGDERQLAVPGSRGLREGGDGVELARAAHSVGQTSCPIAVSVTR